MDLDTARRRRIESFVGDWMADAGVPGAALALVDRGGTSYADGFGAKDRSTNDRATADTLFGVGSVTKSFTTLAVMRLVEAGNSRSTTPSRSTSTSRRRTPATQ